MLFFVRNSDLKYTLQKSGFPMFLFNKLVRAPEYSCLYWNDFEETKISPYFFSFLCVAILQDGT